MKLDVKLTGYTQFSGCGAKLGPGLLDKALCELSQPEFPELLVDYRNSDDAGVWKINNETALVQTVDFFPPIVDDPFSFGRIAAANALSDVYAMGGRPITALSIVAFPADRLEISVLRKIMEGALDALAEAGAALVGGHSIRDSELKFGLAVTGLVHPEKTLRNNRIRPDDVLVLTKPIGTGVINCALKAGAASEYAVEQATVSMSMLNKKAAGILSKYRVNACTDVTGFGLLGHACEMIVDSGCGMEIRSNDVLLLEEAAKYAKLGFCPGGTASNREYREKWIVNSRTLDESTMNILFDPQTSGGLLAAVHPHDAPKLLDELRASSVDAFAFGSVTGGAEKISVVEN